MTSDFAKDLPRRDRASRKKPALAAAPHSQAEGVREKP